MSSIARLLSLVLVAALGPSVLPAPAAQRSAISGRPQQSGDDAARVGDHPLWFAPTADDLREPALARFASGVQRFQNGEYSTAAALFATAAARQGELRDYAAYYAALARLKSGDMALARRQLVALGARRLPGPLGRSLRLTLGDVATSAREHREAVVIYGQLLDDDPVDADAILMLRARAAVNAADTRTAVAAATRVYTEFATGPQRAQAAGLLARLGALPRIRPGSTEYRQEREAADALFDAGRFEDARQTYARLLPHAAGAERERFELRQAICAFQSGAAASAAAVFRRLRTHRVLGEEAGFYEVMSARRAGHGAAFERLALDYARRFPSSARAMDVLDALASQYIRTSRDDEADRTFRRILRTPSQAAVSARASWKVGWRAYRRGDLLEAARVWDAGLLHSASSRYAPAFIYWSARAHAALGNRAVANTRYAQLQAQYCNSYYGLLGRQAAPDTALRARFLSPPHATPHVAAPPNGGTIRGLLAVGLYDDAAGEIRFAQQRWGDSAALQATVGWIRNRQGDLLGGARAVRRAYPEYVTSDGAALPPEMGQVIYPVAYWPLIQESAARHAVDSYLLAALIAQESGFMPAVRSRAHAVGLMQLLPATADRYARRLAVPGYTSSLLTTPEVNLSLGTAYFADLVREFGELHFALAGYNAGENRVRRWRVERADVPADIFVEDIPFPETQEYVKRILGDAENYRRVYGPDATRDAPRAERPSAPRRDESSDHAGSPAHPPGGGAHPLAQPGMLPGVVSPAAANAANGS